MRQKLLRALTVFAQPFVAIPVALAIALLGVGYAWYSTSATQSGAFTRVERGAIAETVTLPGVVKAAQSTDLSFQTPGTVRSVQVAVGNRVAQGQVLATLDGAAALASLDAARANLEVQQAKLAAVSAGTRPEQLAIDQTAVAQAGTALLNAAQNAYVYSDDAVHTKADAVFTNPRTTSVKLAVLVPDSLLTNTVEQERAALEPLLASWQQSTSALATDSPADAAALAQTNLAKVSTFLNDLSKALNEAQASTGTGDTTLSATVANVNAARLSIAAALSALTGANTAYRSATGALTLAQAGATPEDIAAQQAQVDAAQAMVATAQVATNYTVLRAPVAGVVTAQNAHLGETVLPGVPLISLDSTGRFQADLAVSEADIAKVSVGEAATATFDSYPGTTFAAHVTTVNPAATVTNGVPAYTVTITFDDASDARIKAGLTANVSITAATKQDVLMVPQSAVIVSGSDSYVYVQGPQMPVRTKVVTGIVGADGMVEVVRGVSEGEKVLTFGASASGS